MFLYGYPHVPRMSSGVHDELLCSALYVEDAGHGFLTLANDLIFVDQPFVNTVRGEISRRTGLPSDHIAVCATHTHSGPVTVYYLSNRADPVVPSADPDYLDWIACQLIDAGCEAVQSARPAEVGIQAVEVSGIGTNRHDPKGPADPQVPVITVRYAASKTVMACALIYAMHPTVLHEDSTLISSDFPHFTREYLWQNRLLPRTAPVLFLNGASGDQSPRHTAKENTFAEARRLGERLGAFVGTALSSVQFTTAATISVSRGQVDLELRELPLPAEAEQEMERSTQRLKTLRETGGSRTAVRTAECDVFGAEETLALSKSAADGSLAKAVAHCSPAEIQLLRFGSINLVFWPGEFFTAYSLDLRQQHPDTYVVTLANGTLQGYIVTPEAAEQNLYEAGNAVFSCDNGLRFIEATNELLKSPSARHATTSGD
jgi:neutral ceramidase